MLSVLLVTLWPRAVSFLVLVAGSAVQLWESLLEGDAGVSFFFTQRLWKPFSRILSCLK